MRKTSNTTIHLTREDITLLMTREGGVKGECPAARLGIDDFQVMLKGYSSGHSRQTTDRWVEPYMFMSNNSQVRCYELKSGLNKTFNISRIQGVELLPLFWEKASLHRTMFTDVFHFSGEERILNAKTADKKKKYIKVQLENTSTPFQEDEDHWLYSDWVCSYVGVGRFVLGLPTEVEILQDEGLKSYIKEQIKHYTLD